MHLRGIQARGEEKFYNGTSKQVPMIRANSNTFNNNQNLIESTDGHINIQSYQNKINILTGRSYYG